MDKVVWAVLLLLCCCDNNYEKITKKSISMTIYNAAPVQFWINGEETFNQKEVCGVTPICFCQPFNCTDDIKIVVNSDNEPTLNIYKNDVFFNTKTFSLIKDGVWASILNFSNDFSECDGQFTLFIAVGDSENELLDNPEFESTLTPWVYDGWEYDDNTATYEFNNTDLSGIINQTFTERQAGSYTAKLAFVFNNFDAGMSYTGNGSLVLKNNGAVVDTISNVDYTITPEYDDTLSISFSTEEVFDEIQYSFVMDAGQFDLLAESEMVIPTLDMWYDEASPDQWNLGLLPTLDFTPLQLSTPLVNPPRTLQINPLKKKRLVIDFDLLSTTSGEGDIPVTDFTDLTQWVTTGMFPAWTISTTLSRHLTVGSVGDSLPFSDPIRNKITDDVLAYQDPFNPSEPYYGPIKTVVVEFDIIDDDATGGIVGDIEMKCEFYDDNTLVATSTNQIVSSLGSHTNTFSFNDADTFNNVRIAVKRNTGTMDDVLVRITSCNLRYEQEFTSLEVSAILAGLDGNPVVGGSPQSYEVTEIGNYEAELFFEIANDFAYIQLYSGNFSNVSGVLRINSVRIFESAVPPKISLDYINLIEQSFVYQSDCLSIKESHQCTVPILYSNASDFAGLSDTSPMTQYLLRIPAIFFEEDNKQEQEDLELSSEEIVRLYNKVEETRELRIGFMPHYMHRKLLLALCHDFVTIDGKSWIKREEYKKNEGNRHYPLRTASVVLHDKNFIKENQLT